MAKDSEYKYIVFGGALLGYLAGAFFYEGGFGSGAAGIFTGLFFRLIVTGGIGALLGGGVFHLVAKKSAHMRGRFKRTEQDIPFSIVGWGILAMFLFLWLYPDFHLSFTEAVIIIVISMFFVAVSARMVGLIGTTNQPVSGMTITALLVMTLLFVAAGHVADTVTIAAITGGAVVCIAISLSGDLSQDLKTAALIGATPWKVQLAQMAGTLASAVRSGFILLILYKAYGFGAPTAAHPNPLEAPQAQLMAKLVEGVTGGNLPWTLMGLGAAIGVACELCGISALAFAIGLYLPITNWPMVLLGGIIAYIISRKKGEISEDDPGSLYSSGLIAGDALMGIAIAGITVLGLDKIFTLRNLSAGKPWFENMLSTVLYLGIAVSLYLIAEKKIRRKPAH